MNEKDVERLGRGWIIGEPLNVQFGTSTKVDKGAGVSHFLPFPFSTFHRISVGVDLIRDAASSICERDLERTSVDRLDNAVLLMVWTVSLMSCCE